MLGRDVRKQIAVILSQTGVRRVFIATLAAGAYEAFTLNGSGGNGRWSDGLLVPLACATKPLAASVMVEALAEAGETLDLPLAEVLEAVPAILRHTTLRDLLSHQTRVPASVDYSWLPPPVRLQRLDGQPPAPESPELNYREFHYLLAAAAVEKVTASSFPCLLQQWLFAPAGTRRSTAAPDPSSVIPGHLLERGQATPVPSEYLLVNAASHGIHVELGETERLLRHIRGSAEQLDRRMGWLTPVAEARSTPVSRLVHPFAERVSYCAGWWREEFGGSKFFLHPGVGSGTEASLGFSLDHDFAYAIFSDSQVGTAVQTSAMHCIRLALYDAALKRQTGDLPRICARRDAVARVTVGLMDGWDKQPATTRDFNGILGCYSNEHLGTARVESDSSRVVVRFDDERRVPRWLFGTDARCLSGRIVPEQKTDTFDTPVFAFDGDAHAFTAGEARFQRV